MKRAKTAAKPVVTSVNLEDIASKPLTKQQRDRIAALAALPDDRIDTGDIPEVAETTGWVHNPLYRPLTQSITIRLNAPDIAVARSLSKKRACRTKLSSETFCTRPSKGKWRGSINIRSGARTLLLARSAFTDSIVGGASPGRP